MPIEQPLPFFAKLARETARKHIRWLALAVRYAVPLLRVTLTPRNHRYTDVALTPATETDADELELFDAASPVETAAG